MFDGPTIVLHFKVGNKLCGVYINADKISLFYPKLVGSSEFVGTVVVCDNKEIHVVQSCAEVIDALLDARKEYENYKRKPN